MNFLLIGNIILLFASLIMIFVGTLKDNKKVILLQTAYMSIMVAGELCLGSIPSALSSVIAIIRNVLCYNKKLNTFTKIALIVVLAILSLVFNNIGWVVLIPIAATAIFTWFMDTNDVAAMKVLILTTSMCWAVHDFHIQAYTVLPFDIMTIVSTAISLISYQKIQYKIKNNTKGEIDYE